MAKLRENTGVCGEHRGCFVKDVSERCQARNEDGGYTASVQVVTLEQFNNWGFGEREYCFTVRLRTRCGRL